MQRALTMMAAAVVAVPLAFAAEEAFAARRVAKARAILEAGAEYRARGQVQVIHRFATSRREERFTVKFQLRRLEAGTYHLFGQDPDNSLGTLEPMPPYTIVAGRNRRAALTYDSSTGELPFGSTLEALGGKLVQIRTGAGEVLLAGRFPELED